jgi:hypothetical protein
MRVRASCVAARSPLPACVEQARRQRARKKIEAIFDVIMAMNYHACVQRVNVPFNVRLGSSSDIANKTRLAVIAAGLISDCLRPH